MRCRRTYVLNNPTNINLYYFTCKLSDKLSMTKLKIFFFQFLSLPELSFKTILSLWGFSFSIKVNLQIIVLSFRTQK